MDWIRSNKGKAFGIGVTLGWCITKGVSALYHDNYDEIDKSLSQKHNQFVYGFFWPISPTLRSLTFKENNHNNKVSKTIVV